MKNERSTASGFYKKAKLLGKTYIFDIEKPQWRNDNPNHKQKRNFKLQIWRLNKIINIMVETTKDKFWAQNQEIETIQEEIYN